MSDGPDPGTVIVAIFLIVFGACFALAGGGCTFFILVNISELFRYGSEGGFFLLALSLGALAAGIFMIWGAIKLLNRRDS
jgi:hypothetical protein